MDLSLPIIIVGAGGHAKVIAETLLDAGLTVRGLTAQDADKYSGTVLGLPVIGSDDVITTLDPATVRLANGIGFIVQDTRRHDVYEFFTARGFAFQSVIHPTAIMGRDVKMDDGVQICAGAIIQPSTRIGVDVIINTGASLDHDCSIGAHTHIAPGATLSGNVEVGTNVLVGVGASVIQGVRIGANCIIGAGAAVIGNIPPNSWALGVPARQSPREPLLS